MTCNCDNDGSNEYIIELGEFGLPGAKGDRGEQGYSPVVSYTTNSDTIQFTLVNENSTLTTPNYYDYLAKKDLSNSPIYTILSNYPTNSQVASTYLSKSDAVTTYLKVDGSNATNPIALNNFKIQSVGTGTRVGSDGQLTLYGSTARPAYIPQGNTPKTLALFSDIPTIGNGIITIRQGGVTKGSFNVNQSTNNTIDLDAGGGGVSGNRIQLITEDGTRGVSLGINNTTKEAFMTYDIIGGISFDLNLISGKTAPITLTKNSDGTYGIGLDYDNDTLKVNQDGQLYADIEAPTYTAGTGIDINNEEISVDSDYIEAHKAYLADGDTLTDPQGLQDVKYYNYSSFDKNKFTKVGSPTITDDGIASGFVSSTNFINATYTSITPTTSIDIWTKVIITDTTETSGVYWAIDGNLRLLRSSATAIGLRGFNGTLRCDITGLSLALNDEVIIHANVTGTNATVDVWVNGVKSSNTVTNSNTIGIAYSHLVVGGQYSNGNYSPLNSIDLKYQRVLFDGVEVFSGNKTGLDVIKPNDYTVVGTPTISADGVASGFSAYTTYIQTPIKASELLNKSWEIHSVVKGNNYGWCVPVCFTQNAYGDTTSNITTRYGANNVYLNLKTGDSGGTSQLSYNNDYRFGIYDYRYQTCEVVLAFDYPTGIYSFYFIDEAGNKSQEKTYTPTSTNKQLYEITSTNNYIAFGGGINAGLYNTNTQFDLNSFKIYVNGNLVYQPCLKIPYTESKTGSKVVDDIYRGRVNDMAEQFGYAPYYTLSNTDFTLPMGELYGYITRLETLVSDLQTRLSALENNINGGGAGVVQQGLLGVSPLSLGRPQLLGMFNPEDEMNTMDIEPTEEVTQEELEPQPIENEVAQEEEELEPQETTEEEPIEETVEEQEEPQEEGGQDE